MRPFECLLWMVLFVLLWLLMAGTVGYAEVAVGLASAAACTALIYACVREGLVRFRPRMRWFLHVARLPWLLLKDCALLALELWKAPEGQTREASFKREEDASTAAAMRALLNVAVSFLPNSFTIEIDEDKNRLLFHELKPTEGEGLPI